MLRRRAGRGGGGVDVDDVRRVLRRRWRRAEVACRRTRRWHGRLPEQGFAGEQAGEEQGFAGEQAGEEQGVAGGGDL